jgi:hypothetical protein
LNYYLNFPFAKSLKLHRFLSVKSIMIKFRIRIEIGIRIRIKIKNKIKIENILIFNILYFLKK